MPEIETQESIQEMKNKLFLRAVLDAFQAQMLAYYNSGVSTTEERRKRALEITSKLVVIKFEAGSETFTIGAKEVFEPKAEAASAEGVAASTASFTCKEKEFCCAGACLPNGTPCIEGN